MWLQSVEWQTTESLKNEEWEGLDKELLNGTMDLIWVMDTLKAHISPLYNVSMEQNYTWTPRIYTSEKKRKKKTKRTPTKPTSVQTPPLRQTI